MSQRCKGMPLVGLSQGKEEQRREERIGRDLREVKNREKGHRYGILLCLALGCLCVTFLTLLILPLVHHFLVGCPSNVRASSLDF